MRLNSELCVEVIFEELFEDIGGPGRHAIAEVFTTTVGNATAACAEAVGEEVLDVVTTSVEGVVAEQVEGVVVTVVEDVVSAVVDGAAVGAAAAVSAEVLDVLPVEEAVSAALDVVTDSLLEVTEEAAAAALPAIDDVVAAETAREVKAVYNVLVDAYQVAYDGAANAATVVAKGSSRFATATGEFLGRAADGAKQARETGGEMVVRVSQASVDYLRQDSGEFGAG